MSFLTPRRVHADELLDEHDAPRQEMERSLRDLRRINRYLGGVSIYQRMVRNALGGGIPAPTILDLGTGTSDLLDRIRGNEVRRIGLDFKIDHLLYRPAPERHPILRVAGDAFHLPFRDASVDVVTSAHFFHHFTPEENRAILEESLRVARIGVAVNDTQRHIAPLLFVRLLAALRLVGPITRFDAPASVLRGYTLAEVDELARSVRGARTQRMIGAFPFRFGLLLWK
jgi:ubiquinone/menaquinone biosynthesis C-methylase UbiE